MTENEPDAVGAAVGQDPVGRSRAGEPSPGQPRPVQAPNPFVPRYREPWVNPAKRRSAIVLGASVAVVLLALGFLLGIGLAGGGHRHDREIGPGVRPGMYGRAHGGRFGPRGPKAGWRHDHDGYGPHYYGSYAPVESPSVASAVPSSSHS